MKKAKPFKIIKNIIYYSVVLVLIGIIAISFLIPGGIIEVFGVGWYRVVSPSMHPVIRVNDYIFVKKIDNLSNLEDGDIIVFETYIPQNGKYQKAIVTHYFYKVDELGHVLTYPQSQKEYDPLDRNLDKWYTSRNEEYYVSLDNVVGLTTNVIKSKEFVEFMISPVGIFSIVLVSGTVLVIVFIFSKKDGETNNIDDNEIENNDENLE